jgi:16S rRNA (guanine1207-N2)-methyltransferase
MSFRHVSGPVELIGQALEEANEDKVLMALAPEPGLPDLFSEIVRNAHYVHLDYAVYRKDRELLRRASASAEELVFFGTEKLREQFPLAALVAPKEKDLIEYMLVSLWERMEPAGRVLVAGENRAGIKSVKAILEGAFGTVTGHRSGRHAVLWEAGRSSDVRVRGSFRREFEANVAGIKFPVVSYPGVFSHGELDPGTKFLLETLDQPAFRRALDWGCGSGVIGTYLQLLRPESSVDLVDTHALALRSARETMALNGLASDRVLASDGFSDVRGTFDLIVTNPPFHAGVKTELSVTERMIRECGRFLVPGGRLVLVANSFLRYPGVLRESFSEVNVLAENPSYRIFQAKNGPAPSD